MKRLLTLTASLLSVCIIYSLYAQSGHDASPAAKAPAKMPDPAPGEKTAMFAGGCFWCMQYAFDRAPGVTKTVVGYSGGQKEKPKYEEVSSGETGHAESITVFYDPQKTTYEKLLDVFWSNIDPTALNRQFADEGTQYRTAIFYQNDEQKKAAEAGKETLAKSGKFDKPIATQIVPAANFYPAEEYHQEYYKKNPVHFQLYEEGSGRVDYLKDKWGGKANP